MHASPIMDIRLCFCVFLLHLQIINSGTFACDLTHEYYLTFLESKSSSFDNTHIVVTNPNPIMVIVAVEALPDFSYIDIQFQIPPRDFQAVSVQANHRLSGITIEKKGILVRSSSPVAVTAYNQQLLFNSAFLVLPQEMLGVKYFVVTKCDYVHVCVFGIVATRASTVLGIDITDGTSFQISYGGQTYTEKDRIPVFLNKLETLQVKSNTDLTGSIVESNYPIAVISGQIWTGDPSDPMADPCTEQVLPKELLGTDYIVGGPPEFMDQIVAVATEDQTTLTILKQSGSTQTELAVAGDSHHEAITEASVQIESSSPVLLAHFIKGPNNKTGMTIVQPLHTFHTHYVTFTVGNITKDGKNFDMYQNFVLLITDFDARSTLLFDGSPFMSLAEWSAYKPIWNRTFSLVLVKVNDGVHEFYHKHENVSFSGYRFSFFNAESFVIPLSPSVIESVDICTSTASHYTTLDEGLTTTHAEQYNPTQSLQVCLDAGDATMRLRHLVSIGLDRTPIASVVHQLFTRSKLECSKECVVRGNRCQYFSFEKKSGTCFIYKEPIGPMVHQNNIITMRKSCVN